MNETISTGLIGYGFAGEVFHAPVISAVPRLRLTHVVERHGARSRQRYPQVEVLGDAAALFARGEIALVVIATPNPSHFELARAALLAGKHVVVDKPFTVTSAEAEELAALARERGRVLSVFHNRRWDGPFRTLRQLLDAGALGRVVEFESNFDRFRPRLKENAWRERDEPGSGVLYDLGVHLVDEALVLFGAPCEVSAEVLTQREGAAADDGFHLRLHYPGLLATLKAGMLVAQPRPHFAVFGTAGSYVKYGLDPQEDALKRGGIPGSPGWGEEPPETWGTLTAADGSARPVQTLAGDYRGFYENVAQAIAGEAELAVTPAQAALTIRIIELAKQSSATGRRVEL